MKWRCKSLLGRASGRQYLSLQRNGCLKKRTIQHEMMHAVGFNHEHNRPVRDEYIKVLWDEVPFYLKDQFIKNEAVFFPNSLGPYDYYSLVHYGTVYPRDPEDPRKTLATVMEILEEGIDINRMNDDKNLTEIDIRKIKEFYSDKFKDDCFLDKKT